MRKLNIEAAVRLYYETTELRNKDIGEIFGLKSVPAIIRLKEPVFEKQAEYNYHSYYAGAVRTDIAYEVWGFDIDDLEKRLKKLDALEKRKAATV